MVVMINGSFGVGKTTVANLLQQALPGSEIYDPEWTGFVLRRLPAWISLEGAGDEILKIHKRTESEADGAPTLQMISSPEIHQQRTSRKHQEFLKLQ